MRNHQQCVIRSVKQFLFGTLFLMFIVSQRSSAQPGNQADLIVDQPYLASTLSVDVQFVQEGDCWLNEGCVNGTGLRLILRFGTKIANVGLTAFELGAPNPDDDYWDFDECHGHWHYTEYADYQLFDLAGNNVGVGHKQGFCVIDLTDYNGHCEPTYTSCSFQGISPGCADVYNPSLPCQWVDMTGLDEGIYTLKVTTNPNGVIEEASYDNNSACVTFEIQGNSVTVRECLGGDVTGDGEAGIFDALIIATYTAGLEVPPEFLVAIGQGCGDVTIDAETTIFDALVIATFAAGLPVDPYPVGELYCP